jgi:four helix bundle protein
LKTRQTARDVVASTTSLDSHKPQPQDRLESFGIYQIARQLFQDFWSDSELLGKDYRGRELVKQQVRSLDSICANIEEGFGRGFGKELPQHLKIARGEARESRGRYARCAQLLPAELIQKRVSNLDQIIGGLTKTINTIEAKQKRLAATPVTRHPSPVTQHRP